MYSHHENLGGEETVLSYCAVNGFARGKNSHSREMS